MKISLNGSLLQPGRDLEEMLQTAAEYGYDGADLSLEAVYALNPDAPASAGLALFEKYGVYPSAWGLPLDFRGDEHAFEASLANFPKMAKLAAELDCPRMCTWIRPAVPDPDEARRVWGSRLGQAGELAAEHGVRIGLEWVAPATSRAGEGVKPFIWRMDQMLEWEAEMGGDNFGLLVDSWHWYHAGHTVAELEALAPEQIVHVHINDAPDAPKETLGDVTDRLMPGEGVIDLVGFLGALKQVGYKDYIAPEVMNPRLKAELSEDEALRHAVSNVRGLLALLEG